VIPNALRPSIMSSIHASHLRINGCLRRAREIFYWPGMNDHVKTYIQKCEVCRASESAQQKEILIQDSVPELPWTKVAVEL
jgi:predicted Fe-S protein YdhL (DUF1289 family)